LTKPTDSLPYCTCEHSLAKHTLVDEEEKTWACSVCDCEEYIELKPEDHDYALHYCKCGHPFKIHAEMEGGIWICRTPECNCNYYEEMDPDELGPDFDPVQEDKELGFN